MAPSLSDHDRDAGVLKQEFADHTILTPPNHLKRRAAKVVDANGREDPDPVRRAENALSLLSNEFDAWMAIEIEALDMARGAASNGGARISFATIYRASHDIRGQAATLGFPLVGRIADGLCQLIEKSGSPSLALIDLHVDAIKAMVRENVRDRDDPVGAALVHRLGELRSGGGEAPAG